MFESFKKFDEIEKKYLIIEADDDDEINLDSQENDTDEMNSENETSENDDSEQDIEESAASLVDVEYAKLLMAALTTNPPSNRNIPENIFNASTDNKEYNKIILSAICSNPPMEGSIPHNLINVTPENSKAVINFVQNYINLEQSTNATGDMGIDDSLDDALDII